MTAVLELVGLGKDYNGLRVVGPLYFEVQRGTITGLLVPNGAGKTTTISMIAGIVPPTRGTARILGYDVVHYGMAARRALGIVPQELALYEELSARHNLEFFGGLYGLRGRSLAERVDWALDVAQLAGRAAEPVAQFSGGMKRRLNLAAGIVHQPAVLVLDEPTVGIDPQSRVHIFDTVRALRDDGMTVLYTSHYMEEAQALCDRVAIMDAGEIVAHDDVSALLANHASDAFEIEVRVRSAADVDAIRAAVAMAPLEGDAAVHVQRRDRSLEMVFLSLTGRGLRDR